MICRTGRFFYLLYSRLQFYFVVEYNCQSGGICMNIDSLMVPELNEELIASKIYKIRGKK